MSLAFGASLDIFCHFFSQVRPPIVPFYEANHVINSWVSIDGKVVVVLNQSTSFGGSVSDYSPAIFVPQTLNFL